MGIGRSSLAVATLCSVFVASSVAHAGMNSVGMFGGGSVIGADVPLPGTGWAGLANEIFSDSEILPPDTTIVGPAASQFVASTHRFFVGLAPSPQWIVVGRIPFYVDYAQEYRSVGMGDVSGTVGRQFLAGPRGALLGYSTLHAGTATGTEGLVVRDLAFLRDDGKLTPLGRGQLGLELGLAGTREWGSQSESSGRHPLVSHGMAQYRLANDHYLPRMRLGGTVAWTGFEGMELGAEWVYDRLLGRIEGSEGDAMRQHTGGLFLGYSTSKGFGATGSIARDFFGQGIVPVRDPRATFDITSANALRLRLTLSWQGALRPSDLDGDGIPDQADACPKQAEDRDGFDDSDGCPDGDNDRDGVPDAIDRCPRLPEDTDGFDDADGCPDQDNDGDGLPDKSDQCPVQSEDRDGFLDSDGCPDPDNDRDGVPDIEDRCAVSAEDRDGFEDEDGCPDPDNDGDGVPDAVDACPDQAETYTGEAGADGCPDPETSTHTNLPPPSAGPLSIGFAEGQDIWSMPSYRTLDRLAQQLKAHPRVSVVVKVRGADPELAEARAVCLRDYLRSWGVRSGQLGIAIYQAEATSVELEIP